MAKGNPLLKGMGILFFLVLIVLVAVFFYAYFTGGAVAVGSLFGRDVVGVLVLEGPINDSQGAIRGLKRFAETDRIRAVVVRIDSPGGGVVPTQEIYGEIERLKEKKPIIASLGGMATSGGYYIASASNTIVANPGTLTGSIGVIMELANVEGLMQKLGLQGYNIKSGPHKDIGSPWRPLSPEGREILQALVDNVHSQFVRAVAKGRGMSEAKARELADGRIYSGEQAKGMGLVDLLGNLEDAIDLAAKRTGIEGEPNVIYIKTETKGWLEELFLSFLGRQIGNRKDWGIRYQWSPSLIQR
jgi:protease-4